MYTLRIINSDNVQYNKYIGTSYHVITQEKSSDEFSRTFENQFGKRPDQTKTGDPLQDSCYGFIVFNDGSEVSGLYISQRAYIMGPDGKTFENLTWK